MKLVFLDGHALNPGDLPAPYDGYALFQEFGEVTVYDRTPPGLTAERIGDAEAIFTNKVRLDAELLADCPNLRYIGVMATGYNTIDVAYAAAHGITVTNIPDYSTDAVAQHVFALLLALTNRAAEHDRSVKAGEWAACPDFCYFTHPLTELSGKTMGIIGYGHIGRRVAEIARAFGMRVLVHSRTERAGEPVRFVGLDELLAESDVVSLHCPLFPETRGLIGQTALARMKHSSILINTARGPIVDEAALADALRRRQIAGAGVDVLSREPAKPDNPLLSAPHCLITPHIAWGASETRIRLLEIAADNLRQYLNHSPVHVVQPPVEINK